jgi:death-on-curing protein
MKLLTLQGVIAAHDRQIEEHGGAAGMRDQGLLESALGRVEMHGQYSTEDADVFFLAAVYLSGIAKAHAFVDGNKRTAVVAAFGFLRLNKVEMRVTPAEVLALARAAATDLHYDNIATWLREHARR